MNNHVSENLSFASIFKRHANFDAHSLKIALTDQAWFVNNIQLMWIDEQTPHVGFVDQVSLFQVTQEGYCTNRSLMLETIINNVIAINPKSRVFLAQFVINNPSAHCDHYLAVHAMDCNSLSVDATNMVHSRAPCSKACQQTSAHILQSNLTDLARTQFALALQWSLQYMSQHTVHASARCVTNSSADALFKIINTTVSYFKRDSTNTPASLINGILNLRGALYLTTENTLHVYFEP